MKSYFANSVQGAIEQARREMGAEAVLVTSRGTTREARHLGEYEVVFATELPEPGETSSPARESRAEAPAAAAPAPGGPGMDSMMAELRDLRRQMQSWRQSGLHFGSKPHWIAGRPELEEIFDELIGAEIAPDLAEQLLTAHWLRSEGGAPEPIMGFRQSPRMGGHRKDFWPEQGNIRSVVATQIQSLCHVDSVLGMPASEPRMVALVGPSGAGKTTTIAKLAVTYGLTTRKPAMLISFDTLRVAASEQLRWYASILGIGFQAVDSTRGLTQALEEHRNKDLIFIDTPGFSLRDLEGGCDAADLLARRTDIQKHLVLPATMRYSDMHRISSAYDAFQPSHLIFTRMDETGGVGPVLSEAVKSGRPISFLGDGQRVPEDLHPAAAAELVEQLLPQSKLKYQTAFSAA